MVIVNQELIIQCYDFAETAWNNRSQSQRQFGTHQGRDHNEFMADQILGKLAECVFKLEVEEAFNNVEVDLNFEHYNDPLQTDDGDIVVRHNGNELAFLMDIKGSSKSAQWLLIENHKFWELQTGAPMADRYVMVKFSELMPTNPQLRQNPEHILQLEAIEGEIVGWANHADFISPADNKPWFTFERGNSPWKKRVLPYSSATVTNIRHLNNFINYRIRINGLTDDQIYVNVVLDAELNIGLPIHW